MKAILEFDLPDDENEFSIAKNAGDYHAALFNIQDKIYRVNKWEIDAAKSKEDYLKIIEAIISVVNEEVNSCKMLS